MDMVRSPDARSRPLADEKIHIDTVEKFYNFLLEILKNVN